MIVTRGLGRPAGGSLVAFGLGRDVLDPVVPVVQQILRGKALLRSAPGKAVAGAVRAGSPLLGAGAAARVTSGRASATPHGGRPGAALTAGGGVSRVGRGRASAAVTQAQAAAVITGAGGDADLTLTRADAAVETEQGGATLP